MAQTHVHFYLRNKAAQSPFGNAHTLKYFASSYLGIWFDAEICSYWWCLIAAVDSTEESTHKSSQTI